MEGEPTWLQLSNWDAQLLHRAPVQKVDVVSSVDEHARETTGLHIEVHDGI
jgi:hypothetical protein